MSADITVQLTSLDVAVFSLLVLSLLRVRMSVHVYAADDEQVRLARR